MGPHRGDESNMDQFFCGCACYLSFSQADNIGPWQITSFNISEFVAHFTAVSETFVYVMNRIVGGRQTGGM